MQQLSESFEDLFRQNSADRQSLQNDENSNKRKLYISLLTILYRICGYKLGAIDILEITCNSVSSTVAALLFVIGSGREAPLICGAMASLLQLSLPVTHFPQAREDEVDMDEACTIFSFRMQTAVTTLARYRFLELVIGLVPTWIDKAVSSSGSQASSSFSTASTKVGAKDLHRLMYSTLSMCVSGLLFPAR
jgi:hypothetical protein